MLNYIIRPAIKEDQSSLEDIIATSVRILSSNYYTDKEIENAITHIFGVDSELVEDGTYYAVEQDGQLVACGGWSKRRTLFGSDRYAHRKPGLLDPAHEPAKIRAFFVHPAWARQGIGSALLQHCEIRAQEHGFSSAELMATLPGVKLYAAFGYAAAPAVAHTMPNGTAFTLVPMHKRL